MESVRLTIRFNDSDLSDGNGGGGEKGGQRHRIRMRFMSWSSIHQVATTRANGRTKSLAGYI